MTFKEAKDKLATISGGRYRALYYTITTLSDGTEIPECRLYIDSGITHDPRPSWAQAFEALEARMNPTKPQTPSGDEAPEE